MMLLYTSGPKDRLALTRTITPIRIGRTLRRGSRRHLRFLCANSMRTFGHRGRSHAILSDPVRVSSQTARLQLLLLDRFEVTNETLELVVGGLLIGGILRVE